ncbi:MAG: right-handed parallel beta-helix repeat-containing protein, partial [Euryarchaeota archaeon]|nr:right-handed parallel beta-helix repeat-containing protein [Euryarchaeota archaeon]
MYKLRTPQLLLHPSRWPPHFMKPWLPYTLRPGDRLLPRASYAGGILTILLLIIVLYWLWATARVQKEGLLPIALIAPALGAWSTRRAWTHGPPAGARTRDDGGGATGPPRYSRPDPNPPAEDVHRRGRVSSRPDPNPPGEDVLRRGRASRRRAGAAVAIFALLLLSTFPLAAQGATRFVNQTGAPACDGGLAYAANHTTIQAAINAAGAGDEIRVCAGNYTENVTLNRSVTFRSNNTSAEVSTADVNLIAPASQDAITVSDSNVTLSSAHLLLTGNLTVQNGGTLYLQSTTLRMNATSNGSLEINLTGGGKMEVLSGSNITNLDNKKASSFTGSYGYFFKAQDNSTFTVKDSEIHGVGYGGTTFWFSVPPTHGGLILNTSNALIENATLSNNNVGLARTSSLSTRYLSNLTVANSTLRDNADGFYLNYIDRSNFTNITVVHNEVGLFLDTGARGPLTFTLSNISYNSLSGADMRGSGVNVTSSTFSSNGFAGSAGGGLSGLPIGGSMNITGNLFHNNTGGAIRSACCSGSAKTDINITGNTFTDNGNSYGIYSYDEANRWTIANNTLSSSAGATAIYAAQTGVSHQNYTIRNNTIRNFTVGIRLGVLTSGVFNATVADNIINNTTTGVLLMASRNITAENNTISNTTVGILLTNTSGSAATGNRLADSNQSGILLSDRDDVSLYRGPPNFNNVSYNTVTRSRAGINLSGANQTLLLNNTINTSGDGILLFNSTVVNVSNNNASFNDIGNKTGIRLVSSFNNTLTWNTLLNNSDTGLHLLNSSNNTLSYNTIANNTLNGTALHNGTQGSANNTLAYNNIHGNGLSGLNLSQPQEVNATSNWWGTSNCIDIRASIHDQLDDPSIGTAAYIPLLSAPYPGGVSITCGVPTITSWSNNKTQNTTATLTLNISEPAILNATANQTITTWTWTVNGTDQGVNNDTITLAWETDEVRNVSATGANLNGTTSTLSWTITVSAPAGSRRVVNKTGGPACTTGVSYNATIQGAINRARQGDDIVVCAGTYTESLAISTPLTLRANNTTYDAAVNASPGSSDAITVTASNVNISWLKVQNATGSSPARAGIKLDGATGANLSYLWATSNYYGVHLSAANGNGFNHSNASGNENAGIRLASSGSNTLTNNTANNNSNYGVYLSSSGSNTLANHTAGNNTNYGIYLLSSTGNTLTNSTARGNFWGIYLDSSSNSNTLNGSTASNNTNGIQIVSANSNTLTLNTANSNTLGITLSSSGSNVLRENNVSENTQNGIQLASSDSNNLSLNTLVGNLWSGINLTPGNSSRILNNSINGSGTGIYLHNSTGNTLAGNNASHNTLGGNGSGIELDTSNDTSLDYNTLRLNTWNLHVMRSGNVTASNGTLVLAAGGLDVRAANGSGVQLLDAPLFDLCGLAANGSGSTLRVNRTLAVRVQTTGGSPISGASVTISDANNTNYGTTTSSDGTVTRVLVERTLNSTHTEDLAPYTVSATHSSYQTPSSATAGSAINNSCPNTGHTGPYPGVTFSMAAKATTTTTTTSGGGGGGGGAVAPTPGPEDAPLQFDALPAAEVLMALPSLPSDKPTRVPVEKGEVTGIVFEMARSASRGQLVVRSYREPPKRVEPPAKGTFGYLNILVSRVDPKDIKKADIHFQVPREWLQENGLGPDTVKMNRYSAKEKSWATLSTRRIPGGDTDGPLAYEAETPGFSLFAITAQEAPRPTPTPPGPGTEPRP